MKIPVSLLHSYIAFDEPLAVISEKLTLLGIEVDGIENEKPRFSKVIAAEVQSTEAHPSADHLTIAQVFDGSKEWTIVCGAKNCRKGLRVAFAPLGAKVLDDKGCERSIAEATLRGVVSKGMLCSAAELGIPGEEDHRIVELPSDIPLGQDLTSVLWDPVLELSLTPNLGHCMSALGVARELSAALNRPLKRNKIHLKEVFPLEKKLKVKVQAPELCPRYLCRLIENVKIGPSPFWLKQTLLACGMRPINNVVDITNYIMLKTGQPLHAFDLDKIDGHISVQKATHAKTFTGLDGVQREIQPGALLITDSSRILALAGIMGGADSAVSEQTRSIAVEAALFDALSIRKTARNAKLSTESSQRFEKGIDWQNIPHVLDEACQMIMEICQGSASSAIDIQGQKFHFRETTLRARRVNQILGTHLNLSEIVDILHRLECQTHKIDDDSVRVVIPSYRNDASEEIDLIEDVARIFGYNNIEKKTPVCSPSQIPFDPVYLFEREIRSRLVGQGLQEIITCNLIGPKLAQLLPDKNPLKVLHSKSEDTSILRSSLLPSHLEVVKTNLDQKNAALMGFEIGRVHFKIDKDPIEIPMIGLVFYGKIRPHHWDRKPSDLDFYDLKGSLETLFEGLSISTITFQSSKHPSFHPGRQADLIVQGGNRIGSLGEVHSDLLSALDIKQRVYFAEIDLDLLIKLPNLHIRYQAMPQFPSTERDWTLALPSDVPCEKLFVTIHSFHSPLFEKAQLIDLYIKENRHNATVRFTYRNSSKTISFEEAEDVHAKLVSYVQQKLFPL